MRAVIYVRTSTDTQATGLAAQRMACKRYCEEKGWEYDIVEDNAISGASTARPGLNKMMAALPDKRWEAIVVFSFSRLSRSIEHLFTLHGQIRRADVELVSLTEKVDTTTPIGKAMFGIMGVLAEMERDQRSESTKAGLQAAKERGTFNPRKKKKVTYEDIQEIKRLYTQGFTQKELGAKFGVCRASISYYLRDVVNIANRDGTVTTRKEEYKPEYDKEAISAKRTGTLD